jgi:GDPmannose 4,6-dehydratase
LATGKTYSVRFFIEQAFAHVGISIKWEGKGENEKGIDLKTGEPLIEIDSRYYRPTEVDLLVGDPTKAHQDLGWKHRYDIHSLIKEMVEADLELFRRDKYLLEGGHNILNYNE